MRTTGTKTFAAILLIVAMTNALFGAGSVQRQLDAFAASARGKRIGMITNPSGCDENGNLDADYLLDTAGANITAFFAPEHGLRGDLPPGVGGGDYIDPRTGIPVYAVYGGRTAPTDAQLTNVDALVFDLQDVGVRFYTYVWTMTYCMEAAARNGKTFYIIDRPNPIGGLRVEGAPNTVDYGLIGRRPGAAAFGVATRHGMTVGEIAGYWNGEAMSPKANLFVITMDDWRRDQLWTDTGRRFVAPSPNMRTPDCAAVYPGACIFEGSNLSEGRGTDKPFEKIGAPFVNGTNWANCLATNGLAGVRFDPITFTPTNSASYTPRFSGQLCGGVQIVVTNAEIFDPIRAGLCMLQTVCVLYTNKVSVTSYASSLMGVPGLESLIRTQQIDLIITNWQQNLGRFRAVRRKYLQYSEVPEMAARPISAGPVGLRLDWNGVKARSYRLWRRESFSSPWEAVQDYQGCGQTISFSEAAAMGQRFYRLELLP